MAQASRTVKDMSPRTATKLHRNHFETREQALSGIVSGFNPIVGVDTIRTHDALSAALWASQRQTAYRFGWINAIFNPVKVLLGDDPELFDDEREREWL